MFYTASPEADAARHEDAMEAAHEAAAHEYEQIAAEIRHMFTEQVMNVPLMLLSVPNLKPLGNTLPTPMIEAIDDSLAYDGPHDKLIGIIAQSQCPLVAQLRAALAQHWIDNHAEDLVGAGSYSYGTIPPLVGLQTAPVMDVYANMQGTIKDLHLSMNVATGREKAMRAVMQRLAADNDLLVAKVKELDAAAAPDLLEQSEILVAKLKAMAIHESHYAPLEAAIAKAKWGSA